jgi:hypothetical protein
MQSYTLDMPGTPNHWQQLLDALQTLMHAMGQAQTC